LRSLIAQKDAQIHVHKKNSSYYCIRHYLHYSGVLSMSNGSDIVHGGKSIDSAGEGDRRYQEWEITPSIDGSYHIINVGKKWQENGDGYMNIRSGSQPNTTNPTNLPWEIKNFGGYAFTLSQLPGETIALRYSSDADIHSKSEVFHRANQPITYDHLWRITPCGSVPFSAFRSATTSTPCLVKDGQYRLSNCSGRHWYTKSQNTSMVISVRQTSGMAFKMIGADGLDICRSGDSAGAEWHAHSRSVVFRGHGAVHVSPADFGTFHPERVLALKANQPYLDIEERLRDSESQSHQFWQFFPF